MSFEAKYKTSSPAIGGRDGRTRTDDGKIDLQFAVPKELGGPGGEGTHPEQLFAAATPYRQTVLSDCAVYQYKQALRHYQTRCNPNQIFGIRFGIAS